LKPAITVPPWASTVFVAAPFKAWISSLVPTFRIFPPAIATAAAREAPPPGYTAPLTTTRSADADAARAPSRGTRAEPRPIARTAAAVAPRTANRFELPSTNADERTCIGRVSARSLLRGAPWLEEVCLPHDSPALRRGRGRNHGGDRRERRGSRARFADILQILAANEVEFIVVGMTAGILQGPPITTIDLDLVHRRTPENVGRLLRVLAELDAFYRHGAGRPKDMAALPVL